MLQKLTEAREAQARAMQRFAQARERVSRAEEYLHAARERLQAQENTPAESAPTTEMEADTRAVQDTSATDTTVRIPVVRRRRRSQEPA